MKNTKLKATIAILERWKACHVECKQASDEVMRLFGTDALNQGPLNAMWRAFDFATIMTANTLGDFATEDCTTWLDWFCYENNMGERELHAKNANSKRMKPIRTINDLAKLILEK